MEGQLDWNFVDFAVFGALLAGAGVLFTLAIRKSASAAYRVAALIAVLQHSCQFG